MNSILLEIEQMCRDLGFDLVCAENLLSQIDVNQEFIYSEHGAKTVLLEQASTYSNISMVKLLLKHGADPNRSFDDGQESVLWNLQYADRDAPEANQRRLEIAKILLENGADPHIQADDGEDLLRWATFCHIELDEGEQWEYREAFIRLLESFAND